MKPIVSSLLLLLLFPVAPLEAGILVTGVKTDATDAAYGADASNSDLVNAGASSLLSATLSATPHFGPSAHNNGAVGAANTTADITFWLSATVGSTRSITYALNTSVNTLGYDITSIQTIHGWTNNSGYQKNQNYQVFVSTVGSPTFTPLATVAYNPYTTAANTASTKVNITEDVTNLLASGVDEIRFTYTITGGGTQPSPTIREIDVFGVPSVPDVTAPTVNTLTPADDAVKVFSGRNLKVTFSEPVVATAAPLLLDENFEIDDGGFTLKAAGATGSAWEYGDPDSTATGGTVASGNAGSALGCWGTNIGPVNSGHFADPTVTCLRSPVIDLTGVAGAKLTFAEALDLEQDQNGDSPGIVDTAVVNIIDDITDTIIASAVYSATDIAPGNANWNAVPAIDLAAGVGQMIRIEWCLTGFGGSTDNYLGWYIDDVKITETDAPGSKVTIKNLTDATETSIAIGDGSQVSFAANTMTINPTLPLDLTKDYAIRIGASAIEDLAGNPFAGILDDTTWNFTTSSAVVAAVKTDGVDAAYGADVSNSDLVNSGAASLASTAFSATPHFGPTAHNDGMVGAANITGDITFWLGATVGSTYSITYTLDTSVKTLGYEINSIQTINGWTTSSGFQKNQNYEVFVSTVGNPDFEFLASVAYNPYGTESTTASTKVNITDSVTGLLASGVDQIRFTYTVAGGGGNPSPTIREIDVFGAATTGGNGYANWIAGFDVDDLNALGDDFDRDGVANGVENFFGTDPSVFSPGLVSGVVGEGTFTFTHPQGTLAGDLTAGYQWSKDLATFHADGASDGNGTLVDFTTLANTPGPGFTTVTATVTGTAASKLFVRVQVLQP